MEHPAVFGWRRPWLGAYSESHALGLFERLSCWNRLVSLDRNQTLMADNRYKKGDTTFSPDKEISGHSIPVQLDMLMRALFHEPSPSHLKLRAVKLRATSEPRWGPVASFTGYTVPLWRVLS